VYAATKAGLIGFTKSLSRELGKANITVNCVAPGYLDTDMTKGIAPDKLLSIKRRSPSGKLASVESVAASVSYLLGVDGSMVNGTTITVDAGSTA
jgi:3-oxoacyl-[acyl-carrier protein] reductase